MPRLKQYWLWPWSALSLRQTLFLGAGVGILLPALVLAYFQIASRFENEVNLRVRAPMQQYADVLSRGVAVAIWNVDRGVAGELVDAVMRNPDVLSVTVTDEYNEVFVRKQNDSTDDGSVLREVREVTFNGARVGRIAVEVTSARIERELRNDLFKLGAALAAQAGEVDLIEEEEVVVLVNLLFLPGKKRPVNLLI